MPVWAQGGQAAATEPIPACPVAGTLPAKRSWKGGMAEYKAYIAASKLTGTAEAAAFGQFLQQYPNSDYRLPALQQEMAGNVAARDYAGAERTARAILKNPNASAAVQAGAFTVIAYYLPNAAANLPPSSPAMSRDLVLIDWAAQCGERALATVQAPEDKKARAEYVFNRAAGFVALQRHQYPAAATHFASAVRFNTKDAQSYYWLGIAELYKKPANFVSGLFYIARARALAPQATVISSYLQKAYSGYHGSTDGLDALETTAQANAQPPADLKIESARAIALAKYNQEVQAVNAANEAALAKLYPADTFRGIKQRLTNPATRAAEWKKVKGQTYQLPGIVVSATRHTVDLSVDPFDQQATPPTVDVHLVLAKPQRVRTGEHVTITGTATSFHAEPSFLMVMAKGSVQ
ncbi:MAG: hypothetical protein ACRD2E_04865 [Terriglobales bacterium]